MGEAWGGAWLLWMLVLGGGGFALGSLVVFTMSAPISVRLVAAGLVLAALVFAAGLNVVGLTPALFGLLGLFVMPVLAAIGLRYLWSGTGETARLERD